MTTFIRPRLRRPLGYVLAGTALAVAWAGPGRPSWYLAIVMEVGVLAIAITTYLRAAQDTDEGALAGSRADERQQLLSLRARALGWEFGMIGAFLGLIIGVADKASWWWPFLAIFAVAGFGQLLGWSTYSVTDDAADDAGPGQQAHSQAG